MTALPDEKRRDGLAKPSERKGKGGKGGKLRASDPSAQGGVRAMRDLAATGAGLFVAPLDASRLTREAKKLGGLGAGTEPRAACEPPLDGKATREGRRARGGEAGLREDELVARREGEEAA